MTLVTMSNDCGCEANHLRVIQAVSGTEQGALVTTEHRLGEWCRRTLPLGKGQLLIHDSPKDMSWAMLEGKAGSWRLSPVKFAAVTGTKMRAVEVDGEGLAALADLIEGLKTPPQKK